MNRFLCVLGGLLVTYAPLAVHAEEDIMALRKEVTAHVSAKVNAEVAAAQNMACDLSDTDCLERELQERYRVDQWGRQQFYSLEVCGDYLETAKDLCRSALMGSVVFQIDLNNTNRLKKIIDAVGWPEPPAFSKESLNAAWYLAQHAQVISPQGSTQWDVKLAESILPGILKSVQNGDLTPWHYAAMFDRTAVNSGKPQRFATQLQCDGGVAKFGKLEDPDKLDTFRAEIGMEPFDQAVYDARCAQDANL